MRARAPIPLVVLTAGLSLVAAFLAIGEAASTGFGYLFPALNDRPGCLLPYARDGGLDPATQALLKALAREMEAPPGHDDDSAIPAGVTYLGQFIVHDVSFDAASDATRVIDASQLSNLRTARLDLDSVYGRGPLDQPYLYERLPSGDTAGPRLLFGHRLNPVDVPRDTSGPVTGRALIGDPRNDDHLLLSQMHLAFIAFHNAVVEKLAPRIADPYALYLAASTLVRQHFQWLVLHEFLPAIADSAVLGAVVAAPCNDLCGPRGPYVPVELSMGAFRFGHSMVRAFYDIRDAKTVSLRQMRQEFTFRNPLAPGVASGWEVDWRRFFWRAGMRPVNANAAQKIDTRVTAGLPTEIGLLRAYAAKVPSGQCVADALGVPRLSSGALAGANASTVLRAQGGVLLERTPLWYYVLKEAEIVGHGERLGPLGSRLIADVLVNLLRADRGSILNTPGWRPTLGRRPGEFGMLDLLCVGGRMSSCEQ